MSKVFKDAISGDTYKRALNSCWNIQCSDGDMFPNEVSQWIAKQAIQLGVPSTYISFPLLSAVALTLGESYVEVSKTYVEPIILYSLVAGRSGTNKSGSLNAITKLIKNLPTEPGQTNLFDTGIYFIFHSFYQNY